MYENMTSDATQVVSAPAFEATQYAANVDCPVCHTPNPPSETYCMDCGFMLSSAPVDVSDMPKPESVGKLVSSDGALEFPLKRGENTIGREAADVLLVNSTVSRKHGRVLVEDAGVFIEDIGSANGTFVDGVKLEPNQRVEIKDGSEITIGSVVMKYIAPEAPESEPVACEATQEIDIEPADDSAKAEDIEEPAQAAPEAESAEQPEEPIAEESVAQPVGHLVPKDGAAALALSEGVNTIGRREGANTVVVSDPYCSGRHADLTVQDGVFTITDVGSTNGTLVNGTALEAHAARELQAGDEITLGRPVFTLEVSNA